MVLIGRNEARRLPVTVPAAQESGCPVIYVDSSSTDESLQIAKDSGLQTITLTEGSILSAASARNHGLCFARAQYPSIPYIALIDADCRLMTSFLGRAIALLEHDPAVSIVTGFCNEEDPVKNVFHRVAQCEWDRNVGEIASTGGNMIVRASCYDLVGGFNTDLYAGEEFEFCERIRNEGFRIVRLEQEIVRHDCNISNLRVYAKRMLRSGAALALGLKTYRDKRWVMRRSSASFALGIILPVWIVMDIKSQGRIWPVLSLLLLLPGLRAYRKVRKKAHLVDAAVWAIHCMLSKPIEAVGFALAAVRGVRLSGGISSDRTGEAKNLAKRPEKYD